MDRSPVPFPSLPLQADEVRTADTRPQPLSRVHSTSSLSGLWLPVLDTSTTSHTPQRSQAPYRPHLRPLDLAATPASTPPRHKYGSGKRSLSGSPCRPTVMLTPPLTPSSAFNSSTNGAPSTPPEAHPPLRWTRNTDRTRPDTSSITESPTALKGNVSLPHEGYLTPQSGRSHSISSDADSGYAVSTASIGVDNIAALASGLASTNLTPRNERTGGLCMQGPPAERVFPAIAQAVFDVTKGEVERSHFLMVKNVPSTGTTNLKDIFASLGDIKGIWPRFQESHGVVILAFFDIRQAVRAQKRISSQPLPGLENLRLDAVFISAEQLETLTGKSTFVDETNGSLLISVGDGRFQAPALQNLLSSFGELMSFETTDPHQNMYRVEYHDVRDAERAHGALNDRPFLGVRLRLYTKLEIQAANIDTPLPTTSSTSLNPPVQLGDNNTRQSDREMRYIEGRIRPRSVSASETMGAPDAVRRVCKGRESPQEHSRRCSNDLFFDAVGKAVMTPQMSSRPRSISIGPDDYPGMTRSQPGAGQYPLCSPTSHLTKDTYAHHHSEDSSSFYVPHEYQYAQQYAMETAFPGLQVAANHHWTLAAPPPPTIEYSIPPSPRASHHQHAVPVTPRKTLHSAHQRQYQGTDVSPTRADNCGLYSPPQVGKASRLHSHASDGTAPLDSRVHAGGVGNGHNISEKNQLNVEAIELGKDMRTTVMIKNIPNKMSDKDLLTFIERVCPRRIDFFYLRMDFQNGCNVGYAFVNFITVGDLLQFAKTQLGVKWNMYSSEKVLQMCYATYQGKEALVEKFKNSCIMDERESWRPKIFYSDGPNQGLPELFPPPTHLRRKERSSHNRGALFVPGVHHQRREVDQDLSSYHHRPHPPRMSAR